MKILIISHEFPPIGGGGANACYFLSREFSKLGHTVQIITANYQGLEKTENVGGVIIHRLNAARKRKEQCSFMEMLSFLMKAMPWAERLHKENIFDVCLVFFGIPSGPVGYILKKKYNLPYIIRFGGGDVPGFQERFSFIYKLLGPAIKRIWFHADALVANSLGLKQMALAYYNARDFEVIPNGVDVDYFTPRYSTNDEVIKILFVSRLIERKGLQFVIPQIQQIKKNTSKNFQFIIVGDGPYRETLEQIAVNNEVSRYITFVGQKTRDEILPYYQNADIFFLPSQKEGMPNVVLEAMSCGLPVVMTPCQGAPELIDGNGYISKTEDFAERIIELINDDGKRKAMGEKSRRRACVLFGWAQTAADYIAIMQNTMKS